MLAARSLRSTENWPLKLLVEHDKTHEHFGLAGDLKADGQDSNIGRSTAVHCAAERHGEPWTRSARLRLLALTAALSGRIPTTTQLWAATSRPSTPARPDHVNLCSPSHEVSSLYCILLRYPLGPRSLDVM